VSEVPRRVEPQFPVTIVTARRVLEFVPTVGRARPVVVRIGRPRRDRKHVNGDWVCPFDITGIRGRYKRWIFGIDGVQALALAFHIIPVELGSLAQRAGGGHFRFLGEEGVAFADGCGLLLNGVESSARKGSKRKPRRTSKPAQRHR
jgi:hypothetical protein